MTHKTKQLTEEQFTIHVEMFQCDYNSTQHFKRMLFGFKTLRIFMSILCYFCWQRHL